MYNYFNGEIAEVGNGFAVMDVGGIGYELAVSDYTAAECTIGHKRKLYAYLQVKEDGMALFGFSSLEEKNMFLLLISVSGVGPKMALSVLSGMDCNSLALAILNGDTQQLTKIKGLGKKTSERLVLELREKVVVDAAAMDLPTISNPAVKTNKDMQDAVAILCSLGKNQADAEKLVEAASQLGATSATELVNMAFRIG
ncbi:MAG: Holliday junction branch migration protein RuvA [Corallococcus sp.]|nr:Holliday junction branch migration protein RuvA [Corallococcus sp.]MCM1359435.1 Holliday junction branch migration protein RuvA [Corallococcus sp.]MCM1394753.1 Holliday junction branch migration protein RuvA [Corallococcus sp.]